MTIHEGKEDRDLADELNNPDTPQEEGKSTAPAAPVLVLTPKPVPPPKFDPFNPPVDKAAAKKNQGKRRRLFRFL